MEGIDVASNIFTMLKNHPKVLVPQVVYLIIVIILALALLVPPLASIGASMNSTAPNTPTGAAAMAFVFSTLAQLIPQLIVLVIISALFGLILQGMYIDMATKWQSKDFSLSDSFGVAVSRYLHLFIFLIILTVIEAVIVFVLFSPTIYTVYNIATSSAAPPPTQVLQIVAGALVSILLGFVAFVILAPLLFTAPSMIVIDRKGAIEALKSSIALGKKDFFGIIGVLFIAACVYAVFYVLIILLDLLPYIGVVLTLILSLILSAFLYSLAPMYYITFGKKKLSPTAMPKASTPSASSTKRKRTGSRK